MFSITEIHVELMNQIRQSKFRGVASIVINNALLVRDLKIIEGSEGAFVAMPSRKLQDNCPHCQGKNHLRARFCNDCGESLDEYRCYGKVNNPSLHADVVHPINIGARRTLNTLVLQEYCKQLQCPVPG